DNTKNSNNANGNVPPDFFNRLQTFPLFNKAPKSFHTKVASKLTLMQYHPQEYIIKKGDPSKSMYWILKGTVSVTSTDGESIYAELAAGSFFGEIGILFNRPRTATVVARTKVLVGVLTSDALNTVLKHYPLIERRIRDEAQERLAMQDKKNKYDLPNLISNKMIESAPSLPPIRNGINANATISIQDFIKNLPIFQNLPSTIIHQLALGVEPINFNAFEYIIHKGDTNSDIYFIINGEVEVIDYSRNQEGAHIERILARLSSGSYFGEMSFLSFLNDKHSDCVRSASIRSISTVELMVVKSDKLEDLCEKYPFIVDDMRKTAEERNKLNNSINSKGSEHDNKTRLSIDYIIHKQDKDRSDEEESSHDTSEKSSPEKSPSSQPNLQHPQSQRVGSPSVSPISSDAKMSTSTRNTSFADEPFSRKRKSVSNIVPSVNYFQNFQFANSTSNRNAFQYMPHNKRIRLASISGTGRRRSSILSNNGPLPDRILLRVFEFLSLPELMKLRIISRRWRQLLSVASNLCTNLDLTPWNTSIDDQALISITDFVGTRPQQINISNCFHITDEGFSYMVNEIGISGNIKVLKMKSNWEVSAMAIMDLTVPSVGGYLEEIDLSNCRKVRDIVLERLLGWDSSAIKEELSQQQNINGSSPEIDHDLDQIGCKSLKILNIGYCKHLTDNVMQHIANHASQRLESLDLTRCTAITDRGFQYWTYKSFPNLKKLSLKDCTFLTDKSIISIANSATNLEILDLNFCCALSDIAIEVLCLGCPNIRELDLSFCGSAVSDSSLVAISLHLRSLEKLILKGCVRVTRAGVDALLSGCSPLSYINISQCKNAHIYPGNIPAQKLNVNPQTKSAFVTAGSNQNIIEIVI
ncbi:Leucine rich repeat protein, contains F-box, partial [Scheffersomyces stipitis CBS 6054]